MYRETAVDKKMTKTDTSNVKDVLQLSREVGNQDLWKIYGRESEAGKLLFKLFGKGPQSIKISYPKPKTETKPLPFEVSKVKSDVVPPQKTVIEYPEVKVPGKKMPKVHAVDLIPKRKNEVEIRKEIDEFYSKVDVPANKGVDRKKMVGDLQAKFKKQRGALPKGAELPLPQNEVLEELTEEEIQQRALQKIPKKMVAYTYERPKDEQENKKGCTKEEADEELDQLYQDIEREIEERSDYLEKISHLDEPKLKERIKAEIVERVAELQKIIKLMRKND
jgi:hypothetical protein